MTVPDELIKRLSTWNNSAIQFFAIGITLAAAGILAGSALAVFTEEIEPKYFIKILGFIAAVCTGILAAFNPLGKGAAFRQAWGLLDNAALQHKAEPVKYSAEYVIDAARQGQLIIDAANKQISMVQNPPGSAAH